MTRNLVARLLLLFLAGALLSGPASAPAEEVLPLERFKQRMMTFETFFAHVGGQGGERHSFADVPLVLRWDAWQGVGGADSTGGSRRWLTWAGEASHGRATLGAEIMFYGPVVDAAIAELWAEARAGFPNTAFTHMFPPIYPENLPLGRGMSYITPAASTWYWKVELPFAWAEPYDVYLELDEAGNPTSFLLQEAGAPAGTWLSHRGMKVEWDVPLRPDFDRRTGYIDTEAYGGAYWHDEGGVRSRFTHDPAASTAEPTWQRPDAPPTGYTQLVWNGPCTANTLVSETVHQEFHWDADTDLNGIRGLDAMDAGCVVNVNVNAHTWFQATPKAKVTFNGSLTLKTPEGVVIATTPLQSVLEAPAGAKKQSWSPHEKVLPLPAGVEYPELDLVLDGTLTHKCVVAGPAENQAAIQMFGAQLKWPGCWPEMGILTP